MTLGKKYDLLEMIKKIIFETICVKISKISLKEDLLKETSVSFNDADVAKLVHAHA